MYKRIIIGYDGTDGARDGDYQYSSDDQDDPRPQDDARCPAPCDEAPPPFELLQVQLREDDAPSQDDEESSHDAQEDHGHHYDYRYDQVASARL